MMYLYFTLWISKHNIFQNFAAVKLCKNIDNIRVLNYTTGICTLSGDELYEVGLVIKIVWRETGED